MEEIKNKKGFTLVEIMISVAVFCIACGLVLNVFVKSEKLNAGTEEAEKLSLLATNAIEAAKAATGPGEVGCPGRVEGENGGSWRYTAYFDGEWDATDAISSPVYYMKLTLTPSGEPIITESAFKTGGEMAGPTTISALYGIHAEAGYVEESRDDAVSYETYVHYVFGTGGGR
jgi:prepilin-type N-terminal cleavage/methylation domain-containing protein